MAIILYEHPLSPFAQKVKIALREKGIAFELRTPNAIGSGTVAEGFAEASPFAEVPALIDDGFAIFDSTIMLEYIEQKWPKPDLLPENPALAAKARMIEEVMDTRYEAASWGVFEVVIFRRAEGAKAEALLDAARATTAGVHRWLERQFHGPDWFGAREFGWADLSVAPYLAAATAYGMGPEPGSRLSDWLARAMARPSVAETLAEAQAVAPSFPLVHEAVKAGLFKRQYRDHRLEWMIRSGGLDIVSEGLQADNIRFSPNLS
jgi:glutathione S-transferase